MALTQINWDPSPKETKRFAVSILVGFTIIAWTVWLLQGHWQASLEAAGMSWGPLPLLWGGPMVIGLLSLLHPVIARPFYLVWMGFAFVMGNIMSYLVLGLFFYLVISPLGLLLRLLGYDPLRIRKPIAGSNWSNHKQPASKDAHERLF